MKFKGFRYLWPNTDQYWVGNIIYILTSKGWLYLATVIDFYSRQVIGWSMSNRKVLKEHYIIQSITRNGDCWDNAVAESFFHTLKTELTHHHKFKDREEAKHVIFEYIEVFYSRIRIHSANNYISPVEFEQIQNVA